MTDHGYIYHAPITASGEGAKAIKTWTKGIEIEPQAMDQLRNVARLPFVHKHVAAMPDVHWGMGATIGSVIATKGAIVPAAVGVDIGCGMMAYQLSITADQLPDNLHPLRLEIEATVPHGRTDNGGRNDRGAWGDLPYDVKEKWRVSVDGFPNLESRYIHLIEKHPKAKAYNIERHLGTLGTGNHFIEVCLDQNDFVWVMLHSGSRGPGNKIGTYFIERAKEEMRRYHVDKFLPDQDLAYLVEKTDLFDDYVGAMTWAQDFAWANREVMMHRVLMACTRMLPPFKVTEHAINCHHNYATMEHHFGANVWVTRKGAVRARRGDLGIIPGSMGTGSFIVAGLGNPESFCSCSHGAGRKMSRTEAKRRISPQEHCADTAFVECRKDLDVIDESPRAYKDINDVMAAQADLVEPLFRLRPVVNVKG